MRALYENIRILTAIGLILGVTVLPVALARGPQLPNVEAGADAPRSVLLPRLVAQAGAADAVSRRQATMAQDDNAVTIGPKTAPRTHGGSVLTDLLAP